MTLSMHTSLLAHCIHIEKHTSNSTSSISLKGRPANDRGRVEFYQGGNLRRGLEGGPAVHSDEAVGMVHSESAAKEEKRIDGHHGSLAHKHLAGLSHISVQQPAAGEAAAAEVH